MVKQLPVMIVALLLGACSSKQGADSEPSQPPKGGCYQSQWQAESIPVVGKRMGPEALERYEPEQQAQAPGCP